MYIPRTLQEISIEDIVRMQRDGIEVTFDKLTGLKLEKEKAGATETTEQKTEVKEANEPEENKESEEEDGD